MKYIAEIDGMEFPIDILDEHHVRYGDEIIEVDLSGLKGQPLYSLLVNGESYEGYVYPDDNCWQVLLLGQFFSVKVIDEREKQLHSLNKEALQTGDYLLKAPMPGVLVSILINEGQQVEKGQLLIILESMKMQNELRAPRAGKISRLRVKTGDRIEQRQILLSII